MGHGERDALAFILGPTYSVLATGCATYHGYNRGEKVASYRSLEACQQAGHGACVREGGAGAGLDLEVLPWVMSPGFPPPLR